MEAHKLELELAVVEMDSPTAMDNTPMAIQMDTVMEMERPTAMVMEMARKMAMERKTAMTIMETETRKHISMPAISKQLLPLNKVKMVTLMAKGVNKMDIHPMVKVDTQMAADTKLDNKIASPQLGPVVAGHLEVESNYRK
jgi:hypothetical protein